MNSVMDGVLLHSPYRPQISSYSFQLWVMHSTLSHYYLFRDYATTNGFNQTEDDKVHFPLFQIVGDMTTERDTQFKSHWSFINNTFSLCLTLGIPLNFFRWVALFQSIYNFLSDAQTQLTSFRCTLLILLIMPMLCHSLAVGLDWPWLRSECV